MKLWSSILLCSVTVISCRTSDSAETKDSSWVNPGSLQNKKMTSAPDSSGRRFNINVSYQTSVEGTPGSMSSRMAYITTVFIDVSAPNLSKDNKVTASFNSLCGRYSADTENPASKGTISLTTFDASNNMLSGRFDHKMLTANGHDLSGCTGEVSINVDGQWLVDPVADKSRYSGHNFTFYDPFHH